MARMIEVNRAWELIGDPLSRAAYDRAHGIAPRRATPPDVGGGAGRGDTGTPGPGAAGGAAAPTPDVGQGAPIPATGSDGHGMAGPPPGRPSGTVLTFGRYARWSLGEIARVDPEYLEWLARMPIGWQYAAEIRRTLAERPEPTRSQTRQAPRRGRRGFFGR